MFSVRSIIRWCGLITLAALLGLLGGCGGSSPVSTGGQNPGSPYAGHSYTANGLSLTAAKTGDLSLAISTLGSISGTLTVFDKNVIGGIKSKATSYAAAQGLNNGVSGYTGYVLGSGTDFSGLLNSGVNTSGTVKGTFPALPSTIGGTVTITVNGITYGPYPFNTTVPTPPGTTATGKYSIAAVGVLPTATYSQAFALNDSGQIVGESDVNQGMQAFIWDAKNGIQELSIPNSQYARATGINNGGQIVGTFTPSNSDIYHFHVFLITAGGTKDIGLPMGFSSLNTQGITDDGQVIATATTPSSSPTPPGAVSYYGGAFHDIGSAPNSQVVGFNRSGFVDGIVSVVNMVAPFWQYSGHSTTLLPSSIRANIGGVENYALGPNGELLGSNTSTGNAEIIKGNSVTDLGVKGAVTYLNSKGEAVGNSDNGPFYWTQASGVKYLNSLIDPMSGFKIEGAVSINNNGQIACRASSKQYTGPLGVAILLTPRL